MCGKLAQGEGGSRGAGRAGEATLWVWCGGDDVHGLRREGRVTYVHTRVTSALAFV